MSTVAVICSEHADEDWIFRAIDGALVVVDAAPADVLVISADCLDAVLDHLSTDAAIVVIGDPLTTYARATHVVTRTWADAHLRSLLVAVATRLPIPSPAIPAPTSAADARDAQRAIAAARKLGAAADLSAMETAAVESLVELIDVDRAYCLYYEAASASLWSEAKIKRDGDDRRSVTGLAGFAACTGVVASAPSAGDDARFVGAIDDPNGDRTDHVIAQPVLGSDGVVHAVFIVARRGKRAAFGPSEHAMLARFAQVVTAVLDQLSIHVQSQAILDETSGNDDGIFRAAAREAQAMPRWGDVVRVSSPWLSWGYWLLVVLLAGSTAFVVLARVSTYSAGPAVIRSTARTPITARTGGNVLSIPVAPGDRVEPGAVIARLDDTEQRAAVDRLDHEFETQLRNHMVNPGDAAADTALRNLRHDLDIAHTALDERLIHAPIGGVVGDVRVRPSQHLEPGDVVASVVDSLEGLEVIALLPGEDRPRLAPGMTLRLEVTGYRYVYQSFSIESVSSDVIAPSEARRVLGAEVADSLQITGPVAVVRGRLPAAAFVVDGRTLHYHDGMLGTAEVRVHSEPIVFALVPGTRRFQ